MIDEEGPVDVLMKIAHNDSLDSVHYNTIRHILNDISDPVKGNVTLVCEEGKSFTVNRVLFALLSETISDILADIPTQEIVINIPLSIQTIQNVFDLIGKGSVTLNSNKDINDIHEAIDVMGFVVNIKSLQDNRIRETMSRDKRQTKKLNKSTGISKSVLERVKEENKRRLQSILAGKNDLESLLSENGDTEGSGSKEQKTEVNMMLEETSAVENTNFEESNASNIKGKKIVDCSQCEFSANTKGALKTHMKQSHEEEKITCKLCNESYKHINKHLEIVHYSEVEKFFCNFCDYLSVEKVIVEKHEQMRHKLELFIRAKETKEAREKEESIEASKSLVS